MMEDIHPMQVILFDWLRFDIFEFRAGSPIDLWEHWFNSYLLLQRSLEK